MTITMSPTREKYPLSPKKILKKTLSAVVIIDSLLLIGGIVAVIMITAVHSPIAYLAQIFFGGMLALMVIYTILTYFYQRWYFATYFYDFTPDFIIIKKDPITPKEINIPYQRIQDVYVDQDIFDRMLGLYDVHLSSATATSGMEAHIDGVEKPAADGLRTVLLETVQKKIGHSVQPPQTTPLPTPKQ